MGRRVLPHVATVAADERQDDDPLTIGVRHGDGEETNLPLLAATCGAPHHTRGVVEALDEPSNALIGLSRLVVHPTKTATERCARTRDPLIP